MNNQMIPIGKLFDIEKGELQSTKCTPGDYDFITAAEDWKTHNEYSHECEALIFAAAASGSLGRTHYVDGKFTTSDLCYILTPKDEAKYPLNLSFYHFVFNSLRPTLVTATKSGTSKESINQTNFKNYEIPYFDIELQNFWIDKLKNTLGLKDLLGAELIHQQTLLKKLRQQILQEAIEGKLTAYWREQNPDVEPASELLIRIAAEKALLAKDKKIKAQKTLPSITDEEKAFELPEGWEWCQLGDIVLKACDGPHVSPQYSDDGVPFISTRNISPSGIDFSSSKYVTNDYSEVLNKKCKPEKWDILYTKGGTTGIARVNDCGLEFNVWVHVAVLKKPNEIDPFYIQHLLNSPHCYLQSQEYTRGIGNQDLGLTRMVKITTPLPPLLEQKAIVTKVEELISLCDQLETQITQNHTHAEQLMQAVLKEAFSHNNAADPLATPNAAAHA